MNKEIKYIISIWVLLIISSILSGQNKNYPTIKLIITQDMLPGPNPQIIYKISRNQLTIIKTQKIFNQRVRISENLYCKRFSRAQRDSLRLIINNIDLSKLDNNYTSAVLDGVYWTFDFDTINGSKIVILWNYYLPEFGLLIDFLNNKIPRKKRYISFDYFGIRKQFENK
jgi:hypothetical protein